MFNLWIKTSLSASFFETIYVVFRPTASQQALSPCIVNSLRSVLSPRQNIQVSPEALSDRIKTATCARGTKNRRRLEILESYSGAMPCSFKNSFGSPCYLCGELATRYYGNCVVPDVFNSRLYIWWFLCIVFVIINERMFSITPKTSILYIYLKIYFSVIIK
jgi:hypothetical protein